MLGAPIAKPLDAVADTSTGQTPQPVQRERGTRAIAHEPLATEIVGGGNGHAGVQVESVVFHCALTSWRGSHPRGIRRLGIRVVPQGAHRSALHRDGSAGFGPRTALADASPL